MPHNCTVALKEPYSVRWLSLHETVTAVEKCWPALVAALGVDAATLTNHVANGLAMKANKFQFVLITSLMADVLPLFTKLSKVFQAENPDFAR